MADNPIRFESIPWRRMLPWLALTRAFWIAVDLRKLVLAAAGLLLVSAGSLVFDRLPFARESLEEPPPAGSLSGRWPWQWTLGYRVPPQQDQIAEDDLLAEFRGVLDHPLRTIRRVLGNWPIVVHPLRAMAEPAVRLFRGNTGWPGLADAVTRLLWALVVWSVFGGAIGRIAAVQFARDQQIGIRESLEFSLRRFFGYVSAPLLPLTGVAVLWMLCVVGGWLGRIPGGFGETVLGLLWGLELVFGLMMAVILIGVAGGWPLMLATIGVEGTDGFDGLSRMYNYVFERPLYYIWQIGVVVVYGSAVIFFVGLMAQLLVHLAVWGVSWGQGHSATAAMLHGSPPTVFREMQVLGESMPEVSMGIGAQIARGWMCALATLVFGFVYSYFWTTATIMYFTLRRSVDANDFDEVFIEDEQEADDLLPLVGAASMGATGQVVPPIDPAAQPTDPANATAPVDLNP